MLPNFLADDAVRREDGHSEPVDIGAHLGASLLVTLGITRIVEQQSLDVKLEGSADGATWSSQPVAAFPQKFYCGTYTIAVDLAPYPETKYLRARWTMKRWGRGDSKPQFGFYVFAEPAGAAAAAGG